MANWEQLNFEHRKIIRSGLSQNRKLYEISDNLEYDPTTISKEIKRNRILHYKSTSNITCSRIKRFPYCCNSCNKRYGRCFLTQYLYDPDKAQLLADSRLVNSRRGINIDEENFVILDNIIKDGVDNNQSIYHIVKNNPNLNVSVPTVYRYINSGILSTKRIHLPYAVTYKKRKVKKQYEYNENKSIDRTGRTYIDFLSFLFDNPNLLHVQMDFLGHIKSDKKSILTLTIPHIHFILLIILDKPNASKIVDLFNSFEKQLSSSFFNQVFPCILTDRDSCFAYYNLIESSIYSNDRRTRIFYCDALAANQKGNVEQMNKQLRRFFPKKKSIDHLTQEDVDKVASIINKTRVASLSGFTPEEAFINLLGVSLLDKLKNIIL